MINEGFEKAKAPLLPGISELRRYAESSSTVDSDEFSLESLEIDLFEDIRASIQKSSKACILKISSHQLRLGVAMLSIYFNYNAFFKSQKSQFFVSFCVILSMSVGQAPSKRSFGSKDMIYSFSS